MRHRLCEAIFIPLLLVVIGACQNRVSTSPPEPSQQTAAENPTSPPLAKEEPTDQSSYLAGKTFSDQFIISTFPPEGRSAIEEHCMEKAQSCGDTPGCACLLQVTLETNDGRPHDDFRARLMACDSDGGREVLGNLIQCVQTYSTPSSDGQQAP